MRSRFASRLLVALAVLAVSACRCDDKSAQIDPSLSVSPVSLSFGKVKVGQSLALPLKLTSESRASVTLSQIRVDDLEPAGAGAAYTPVNPPEAVASLQSETFRINFAPTALQIYAAQVVIASDDPDRPEIKITVSGEGATGELAVTPICEASADCRGSATLTPPALDFGAEPLTRFSPLPVTKLPQVALVNEGDVELAITHLAIEGADAAAFTMQGNTELEGTLPDGTPALLLGPGEGRNVAIRFVPTAAGQENYAAELVVRSDDLNEAEVRVPLTGRLAPNLPPVVCANLITVTNGDGSPPASYNSPADWAQLIPAPTSGGYDFTTTRDVQPSSRATQAEPGRGPTEVRFSAHSDPDDASACTSDPEDGRAGLVYLWEILEQPVGGIPTQFGAGTQDDPTTRLLLSQATGTYRLRLTVTDSLGASSSVELAFDAVLKEDLVVQLSWNGDSRAYDRVDLDLHLIRPSSTDAGTFSGAFSFFEEPPSNKTSGDINGISRLTQAQGVGLDFNWGEGGTEDDPRLNLDDTGIGELVENISLNYPERDPRCATERCDYKVMVHYFDDARGGSGSGACNVTGSAGCVDGAQCGCTSTQRCVTNDGAATGAGTCYVAPEFVIRVFVRGEPTPVREIPVTADGLRIGAVCQLMYVADVSWPSQTEIDAQLAADGGFPAVTVSARGDDGSGNITPVLTKFGQRMGLKCQPNDSVNGVSWYQE